MGCGQGDTDLQEGSSHRGCKLPPYLCKPRDVHRVHEGGILEVRTHHHEQPGRIPVCGQGKIHTDAMPELGTCSHGQRSKWTGGYICKLDMAKAFPSVPHALPYHMMGRVGWSAPLLKAFRESMQWTSCSCRMGADEVRWTPKRGLKEGCPMSPVLFMAYYDVYILRWRHPDVLFLSYVDDILFVAASLEEVSAVWRSVDEIGGILGLRAHPGKTELYHWGGQSVGRKVPWNDVQIEVRASYLEYLGHHMVAPQYRGMDLEDFRQRAKAELTRYRLLPLDDWEKVQLLNVVIAPRLIHKVSGSHMARSKGR